jgi:hypothetical protein
MERPVGQSERERILEPGFLDGLADWPTTQVRAARAAFEAEEERISYARRVLQGRLDILHAELLRRQAEQGGGEVDELLARLPGILSADHTPSDPLRARATRLRVPPDAAELEAEVDGAVDLGDVELGELAGLEADELAAIIDRLESHEHHLSAIRRSLFDGIDTLRDELARRYKDGSADVSELLSGS